MSVVKNLMVRAGADFSPITKQAQKVKSSMTGMRSAVSGACSGMSAAADGMKKAFHALGAAVSAAAVISFAKSAKEAYEVQTEGEAKLAQVMRNTIGASADEIAAIRALCSAQQALGVIGDEVQLAGAQELATYVSMASTLKTLIPVMNDMAAQQYGLGATAENTANIATMLGKVMNGQTSALSRYGYTFDAAQEAVLKYGTEAQRAAVLAEVVGQSVGGMNAALAATPSGRLQQVSNTLGDIKEGFGAAVSTVLTVFLPVLNTVCNVLASAATLANKVAQSIANVFGGGAKPAAAAVRYTGAAVSAMDDLGSAAGAAGKAVSALGTYGFDKLQKLSGTSGGSGGGTAEPGGAAVGGTVSETVSGTEDAGESIGLLERALTRLKETVGKLDFSNLSAAMGRLKTAAEPLTQGLFSGLSWAYDNVFEPLAQWTAEDALPAFLDALSGTCNLLSSALDALKPVGEWLWDDFLEPIASWTGSAIISDLETLSALLNLMADVISGDISIWEALGTTAGLVVDGIKKALQPIFDWINKNVVQPVSHAFGVCFTWIGTAASAALEAVKNAWDTAGKWFTEHVTAPIANGLKGFANGVIGFFEGLGNGAVNGVNAIIRALNKISFDIPDWVPVVGGKKFGFSLNTAAPISLPRLASGAVFEGNDPYLAVVNDQKHGVNVETPLSTMIEAMMTALQSADLPGDIRVDVRAVFDGQLAALARLLRPHFEADAKRVGGRASTSKGVV